MSHNTQLAWVCVAVGKTGSQLPSTAQDSVMAAAASLHFIGVQVTCC